MARESAQRSAVLLRNEGGLLPLGSSTKKIAVIGPLGDTSFDTLGSWQAMGQKLNAVTLAAGLKARGLTVEVAKGVQIRKNIPSMFDQIMGGTPEAAWSETQASQEFASAVEAAKSADVVVLAMGELALMSGELASRSSLALPGRQQELMEAVVGDGEAGCPCVDDRTSGQHRLGRGERARHIAGVVPRQRGRPCDCRSVVRRCHPIGKDAGDVAAQRGASSVVPGGQLDASAGGLADVLVAVLGCAGHATLPVWLWAELYDVRIFEPACGGGRGVGGCAELWQTYRR